MRFAGLFDCAKYKAHGESLLVYSENGTLTEEERMKFSSISTNASHKNSAKERLPVLAPLNYAPHNHNATEHKNGFIPISELRNIHSMSK